MEKKQRKRKDRIRALSFIIFVMTCFLAAFIVMEFHGNYIAVGAVGVLLLLATCFMLSGHGEDKSHESYEITESEERKTENAEKEKNEENSKKESMESADKSQVSAQINFERPLETKIEDINSMQELYKALHKQFILSDTTQRAVFLATKKNGEILDKRLTRVENQLKALGRIQKIQENGTKAIIRYNKENAKQVASVVQEETAKNASKIAESMRASYYAQKENNEKLENAVKDIISAIPSIQNGLENVVESAKVVAKETAKETAKQVVNEDIEKDVNFDVDSYEAEKIILDAMTIPVTGKEEHTVELPEDADEMINAQDSYDYVDDFENEADESGYDDEFIFTDDIMDIDDADINGDIDMSELVLTNSDEEPIDITDQLFDVNEPEELDFLSNFDTETESEENVDLEDNAESETGQNSEENYEEEDELSIEEISPVDVVVEKEVRQNLEDFISEHPEEYENNMEDVIDEDLLEFDDKFEKILAEGEQDEQTEDIERAEEDEQIEDVEKIEDDEKKEYSEAAEDIGNVEDSEDFEYEISDVVLDYEPEIIKESSNEELPEEELPEEELVEEESPEEDFSDDEEFNDGFISADMFEDIDDESDEIGVEELTDAIGNELIDLADSTEGIWEDVSIDEIIVPGAEEENISEENIISEVGDDIEAEAFAEGENFVEAEDFAEGESFAEAEAFANDDEEESEENPANEEFETIEPEEEADYDDEDIFIKAAEALADLTEALDSMTEEVPEAEDAIEELETEDIFEETEAEEAPEEVKTEEKAEEKEEVKEEVVKEEKTQEEPEMIDFSDPNLRLNADDIAKLFQSMDK